MGVTRDFTATTFVVHGNRTLLHRHRGLGLLLPPGGHIEKDELPDEAALREVFEETGLTVELVDEPVTPELLDVRRLTQPVAVLLEQIAHEHEHIDIIYFARSRTEALSPGPGEAGGFRWVGREELEKLEMPDNVRRLARLAIEQLGTREA